MQYSHASQHPSGGALPDTHGPTPRRLYVL